MSPPSYPYRAIVVGVDFSSPSRAALGRAADLAARLGARLEVVHVVRQLRAALPFSRANREVVADLQRDEVARAQERLERWRPRARGLDVRMRVLLGTPSEALLAHAKRVGADLVVLSNLGHSSLSEILIGSTAERCLRRAFIPVLLVPASAAPRKAARRPARTRR